MNDGLTAYLERLVLVARDVLGEALLGGYVTGSAALSAYEPGRSDVDVALVVREPLHRVAKEGMVARLRHEALACPARGLELVVYRADVAASGTAAPGFELERNTGATMPLRVTFDAADRPAADGRFWVRPGPQPAGRSRPDAAGATCPRGVRGRAGARTANRPRPGAAVVAGPAADRRCSAERLPGAGRSGAVSGWRRPRPVGKCRATTRIGRWSSSHWPPEPVVQRSTAPTLGAFSGTCSCSSRAEGCPGRFRTAEMAGTSGSPPNSAGR